MSGRKWLQLAGVCFLVAVAVLLTGGRTVSAQPPSGDYCFTVRQTMTEEGAVDKRFMARVHFSALDDHVASLHGYVLISGDNPYILTGIGNQVGTGFVYVNVTSTQNHKTEPWVDTGIMQMKLRADTLAGTFTEVRTDYNTVTKEFVNGFSSGTVAPRTCP